MAERRGAHNQQFYSGVASPLTRSIDMNETSRVNSRARGLSWVLFAGLCLSTTPPIIKVGLNEAISPVPLLTFRLILAAVILWIIFALFQPGKLRIDMYGLMGCALAGAANGISLLFFYLALTYISASVATVIFSLTPIATLLLLSLRGEPFTAINTVRFVLALAGVYLLIGPGGDVNIKGVILMAGVIVSFAIHLVLLQWRLSLYPTQTVTLYTISFMALVSGIVYLFQPPQWPAFSGAGWGVIIWTAVVSTAVARFAMFAGIRYIGSGQTALLSPVETLLTVFWAMLILGEHLSLIQLLGGALILTSATLAAKRNRGRSIAPREEKSA